ETVQQQAVGIQDVASQQDPGLTWAGHDLDGQRREIVDGQPGGVCGHDLLDAPYSPDDQSAQLGEGGSLNQRVRDQGAVAGRIELARDVPQVSPADGILQLDVHKRSGRVETGNVAVTDHEASPELVSARRTPERTTGSGSVLTRPT